MRAICANPASPLGENDFFRNQTGKLGKVAGLARLWAKDLGVSTLEAMMRFYDTPFYAKLEDESTKLWTCSPQQLYYLFRNAA